MIDDLEPLEPEGDPLVRMMDTARISKALRLAAQDAFRMHKRMGNPICVWEDGKVVWIPPEEIPEDLPEPEALHGSQAAD